MDYEATMKVMFIDHYKQAYNDNQHW